MEEEIGFRAARSRRGVRDFHASVNTSGQARASASQFRDDLEEGRRSLGVSLSSYSLGQSILSDLFL